MRHIAATILSLCICISSAQELFRATNYRIHKALDPRTKVLLGLLKRQLENTCSELPSTFSVCPGENGVCCYTGSGAEQCCPGELVPFLGPGGDLISSDGICCPAADASG